MAAMLKVQNNKDLHKNEIYFLTVRKLILLFCTSSMAVMKTLYKPAMFEYYFRQFIVLRSKTSGARPPSLIKGRSTLYLFKSQSL